MSATQEEINAMKKLLSLIDGDNTTHDDTTPTTLLETATSNMTPDEYNSKEMKRLLEAFNDTTETTIAKNVDNIDYTTIKDDNGVHVGDFYIKTKEINSDNSVTKSYDIVFNGKIIVENLILYKVALAVVKLFSKYNTTNINNGKVTEILDLEEMYFRNKNDAIRTKQRYKMAMEKNDITSANIYETKFQSYKANATIAKDRIETIIKYLGI